MPALFIAGAGTEIGKTYVTAALTRRLIADGRRVRTLKPLASGVPSIGDPDFAASDTARLLAAQGIAPSPEAVEACSPWRYAAPLAPDQAAALEGRALALPDLVAWCRAEIARAEDILIIEGVGGLMSPVTPEATGLDWLKALGIPALLVSGSYLGAISHALTACETLRFHGVALRAVAVSESPGAPTPPETVAAAIRPRVAAPVLCIARGAPCPVALADVARG
ncbi:dethiobiotin synthase [Methylobacterium gregans]|uniref:ATP-dependent dethiobiotin synthetase BioD n=1 Tax=Methylobacterium gregans TaxID=374424 RepID=A0AA37MCH7_9HYPH|nr:dethiobiotin synthase [Methylobacterium gregans]MDQ0520420.1 dethiobiotin synthetase [Methylobacterium gregans]GJD81315.1 ATP-dependent dethiobiotin synthetase BioD [Methylobacterium gregans]GLS52322.1 ATP-dependent dethiobiotin synthetase BioD [Methylobacterium gregans]